MLKPKVCSMGVVSCGLSRASWNELVELRWSGEGRGEMPLSAAAVAASGNVGKGLAELGGEKPRTRLCCCCWRGAAMVLR